MDNQNTHFVFDGEKIIISPNLREIATFLSELDSEVIQLLQKSPYTLRANTITIFAYLETLYCLNIVYKFETTDKGKIIEYSSDKEERTTFYKDFLLNSDV
jgi:hypothetical protein